MVIPFILHQPSLFSKVSNLQKKVLTPHLYFPNYCITYLPHDFRKCEHVNLRWEWACAIFEELYYAANKQKIADKKKANYQESLEKSRDDSAAWNRESYLKDPEKSCARNRKVIWKIWKRVVLTVQHKSAKVTRKTWRRVTEMKLALLYPTKVKKAGA